VCIFPGRLDTDVSRRGDRPPADVPLYRDGFEHIVVKETRGSLPDEHGLAVAYLEFEVGHTANDLFGRNAVHAFRERAHEIGTAA
jgi:hypothetical protein